MINSRENAALQLHDVSRTFSAGESEVQALDHVSLDCSAGSWTAVMGPSGSGKSTLLHCAAGLDRPDNGQVMLRGQEIAHLSDDQLTRLRRTDIGFIFQHFNLVAALSALDNVMLPLRLAGMEDPRGVALQALTELGLNERADHKPRELSGGQQQRVAIARALATEPSVMFADEPTGALDSTSAAQVLSNLRSLVDKRQQTILMVTHDPVAAASADRIVFLRDGKIVTSLRNAKAPDIATALAELETQS